MSNRARPIGIFDSGLGGISVVRAVMRTLPREQIVYFGDTARVPYGTKSAATVRRFALQITSFLAQRDIKALVVACNTASAVALEVLRARFPFPIIGVIQPGARAALEVKQTGPIAVIGTTATIRSGAYQSALQQLGHTSPVLARDCPLLVPLVEEGWPQEHPVVQQVLETYLGSLRAQAPAALILGCTHYPYLREAIQRTMGPEVTLIDSGEAAAHALKRELERLNLLNGHTTEGPRHLFYVSDFPQRFNEISARFLGRPLERLFRVEVEDLERFHSDDPHA